MVKNILVTGARSRALSRLPSKVTIHDNTYQFLPVSHDQLDITSSESTSEYFHKVLPDACLHAAAQTDLALCEQERGNQKGLVWKTNVEGTRNVVMACRARNIPCISLSTASVFAGREDSPGPYQEDAIPEERDETLSWYGITKRESEKIVLSYPQGSVLRLASAARTNREKEKKDFFTRCIQSYHNNQEVSYFSTQFLSLTDVTDIGMIVACILEKNLAGVFHASTPDQATPHEIAEYLLSTYKKRDITIKSLSLEEYLAARPGEHFERFYPKYWGLSTCLTEMRLGMAFSPWEKVVQAYVNQDL